jgi:N-methylhydantoinase B
MPNAVIGFKNGQMWMDQGVDTRTMDVSAVQGIDGWGSCPVALGNLLLSEAEDGESRFPVINISREMTIDTEGAGRWRGQPGSLNVKQVDGVGGASAHRNVRRRRRESLCQSFRGGHAQ